MSKNIRKNHGEIARNRASYLDTKRKSSYNVSVMEGVVSILDYDNNEYGKERGRYNGSKEEYLNL